MPNSVPVASNLLESKFLGVSVKRVVEAMAIPIAPCAIGYTIGLPLIVTFPLFICGLATGATMYLKTPPGQRPLSYTVAVLRHMRGSHVYTLDLSRDSNASLSPDWTADEWITRETPPHASQLAEASAAVEPYISRPNPDTVPTESVAADARDSREGRGDPDVR